MIKINKNVLLSTAEKNLIINSSICINDVELKEVLMNFRKSISKNDLNKIKAKNERIYRNLNSIQAREEYIEKSSSEWKNEKPIGLKKKPCQLCENKKSELKYIIVNVITGIKLEVGSSCITKFPKMDEKYHGESISTTDKWLRNFPERIDRLGNFVEMYNGGKDIFQMWKVKYDGFMIEFPSDYDKEFRKIKNNANRIYDGYIKGNLKYEDIKSFQIYIDDFNYFYKKCEKFYEENRNNKYICTKEIAKLLKKKQLNTTLDIIKGGNCSIPKGLAKSISEVGFIKNFKEEIFEAFSKFKIKLEEIDSQVIEFSYKYMTFEPIKLEIQIDSFTNRYSEIFYGENNFEKEEIFNSLTLKNERANINEFLGILEYLLSKKGFEFDYDVTLHAKQITELHKKNGKRYANIPIKNIINNYVKVLYISDKEARDFLIKEIENVKWITYEQRKKDDIGNISSIFALGKEEDYEQYEK